MSSILDILINEVAGVLGISPAEVKSKFTKEQLDELLSNSLCQPGDEVGIPITSISSIPCDDLNLPNLLPPVNISGDLDKILEDASSNANQKDSPEKCIKKVDEVNSIIEKQITDYTNYKTLLDKLLEYRDNYAPVSTYFSERAKEASRILNLFDPILIEKERLETLRVQLQNTLDSQNTQLSAATLAANVSQIDLINAQITLTNTEISLNNTNITNNQSVLTTTESTFPIFSNTYYSTLSGFLDNPDSAGSSLTNYLGDLFNNYVDSDTISTIANQFNNYSEGLTVGTSTQTPNSIQEAIERAYFSFSLRFVQLSHIKLEKETINKQTGARNTESYIFLIKDNPLLEKNSFFKNTSIFSLSEFFLDNDQLPSGRIYNQYYNLFKDPINNFFSLDDRGLTSNIDLVDPKVKGTSSEIKKENNTDYYIKDINVMQDFYQDFDSRFELRKNEVHTRVIASSQEEIRINMEKLARQEVQLLLAIGRVNKYLPGQSSNLTSVIESLNQQNTEFSQSLTDLDSEITRIKKRIEELKPNPANVKALLKSYSPECFEKIDQPVQDCAETKPLLGSDPLFTKTLESGCDPTLPNYTQMCYWLEFAKIATKVGLLPIPNIPNVTQLRYWPVGLVIPYPGGLIKIPLPIIWIPLISISSSAGTIVIFLTINGIFISPVVFFVSNSGFKQHIITIKGPSEKFGYDSNDELLKPSINIPLKLLALNSKAERLSNEASLGTNYLLTQKQKVDLAKQQTILKAAEDSANETNNENRKLRVKREKDNFNQASTNLSNFEKLENILNKTDSAKDVIYDAKVAINNRINELGKPPIGKSNELKAKILERRDNLLNQLKSALVAGDDSKIKKLREDLKSDGIPLSDKISAIKSDMLTYFDRIDFPKVTIPKDRTTIDPKENAITEFISKISDFASTHKTQFFSKDNEKVKSIMLVQLAKSKNTILKEFSSDLPSDNLIDLDLNPQMARDLLLKANTTIIKNLKGEGATGNIKEIQSDITDLTEQSKNEPDKIKKLKLNKDLEKKKIQLSEVLENSRVKLSLALTPQVMNALGATTISFDAFASCCKKEQFTLPLGISPAVPILESVLGILNSSVNSLSSQDLKSLLGGKIKVSANEVASAYIGIIKKNIPDDLTIPLPDLNLLTFAKSFTGTLAALFEIKAPNLAAQPALPLSIKLDLNLLKQPLKSLLLKFLENSLPDPLNLPDKTVPPLPKPTSTTSATSTSTNAQSINNSATLDSSIKIVTCEPDTSQKSILSNGEYTPKDSTVSKPSPESSAYSSGNVIVNSNKDILPAFQDLSSDFLNLNPGDLLVVLKNFIDLKFDAVENLIDPFYTLLKTVKGLKGINLNLLESIQYKLPPYGPAAEVAFLAITTAKKLAPASANFKIIDIDKVKEKSALLETVLSPIVNSPLPALLVAGAGALDSILPKIKMPEVDTQSGAFSTKDIKVATFALRQIHPLLSQDDIPSWERLSGKNLLFLLFLDEFISTGADQVGFFRAFI